MSKNAREIELEKKLEIAEKALTDVCLYRYDVSDTDQEDWFKIATCMAEVEKTDVFIGVLIATRKKHRKEEKK